MIDPPTDPDEQASTDVSHAANIAYLTVLHAAGYGRDHELWPTSEVPARVLNRAVKAGEQARAAALAPVEG